MTPEEQAMCEEAIRIEREELERQAALDGKLDNATGRELNPEACFHRRGGPGRWSPLPAWEAPYRQTDWRAVTTAAYQRGWDEYERLKQGRSIE